jgi:hypothetical protein
MKINKLLFAAIAGSLFFASCNNDDDKAKPLGSYDNGVLVLNEGGLGTVTYVSDDLSLVQQDIFGVVNGTGQDLGAYTQSIFFDGDRAFIISNGSNKITVVNRYTFQFIATISTGLTVPRYGVVYNGKAYVTNSNSFDSATDDFIAVIDLSTLALETPIAVNNQAERLVVNNGKLYVSGGFYGSGDKLTIIDAASKTILNTLTVGESPNSLEVEDGNLFVLCGSWTGPSKLVKVKLSDNSLSEIPFPDTMGNAGNLDIENDKVYFTVGPKIYKFSDNATTITDTPLVDTQSASAYIGYGFAVKDDKIYISEAADDFASDGKIFVYSTNGETISQIPVGLGPNGFYFN